eukprot:9014623-Lingulodinium_polyedra.AAC.1
MVATSACAKDPPFSKYPAEHNMIAKARYQVFGNRLANLVEKWEGFSVFWDEVGFYTLLNKKSEKDQHHLEEGECWTHVHHSSGEEVIASRGEHQMRNSHTNLNIPQLYQDH